MSYWGEDNTTYLRLGETKYTSQMMILIFVRKLELRLQMELSKVCIYRNKSCFDTRACSKALPLSKGLSYGTQLSETRLG